MGLINPNLYCNNRYIGNIGQYAAYDNSEGGSKTSLSDLPENVQNSFNRYE